MLSALSLIRFLALSGLGTAVAQTISYNKSTEIIFEVNGVLEDYGDPVYTQDLGEGVFANTYGQSPVLFQYTPPEDDVEFTNVEFTITGTNFGRQFDRLGHIFVGGVEVWRPSTPEPAHDNITWTFTKDVSEFLQLFKSPQNVYVEIGNVVDDVYTGIIHVEVGVSLFNKVKKGRKDLNEYNINNIFDSELPPNSIQYFGDSLYTDQEVLSSWVNTLPQVPRNTTRLVANIFASGNSAEEFWYTNVLDDLAAEFDWYGAGPTRRVEVLVEDVVVGFAYPFPVVYTGGISPYFWQPVVGINAYEVPSYQVELTPFLPYLWDADTNVTIRVVNGYNGTEAVNSDWYISAAIFGWQHEGVQGSGKVTKKQFNQDSYADTSSPDSNTTVYEAVEISSEITTSAELSFGRGLDYSVTWTQSGSTQNLMLLADAGASQDVAQTSNGNDKFTYQKTGAHNFGFHGAGETTLFSKSFSYPFLTDQGYIGTNGSTGYNLNITRVLYSIINGDKYTSTIQNATSELIYVPSKNGYKGFGSTTQSLSQLAYGNYYEQTAGSSNNTLVYNTTSLYPSFDPSKVPNYHDAYNREIQAALTEYKTTGSYESFLPIFYSSGNALEASFPFLPHQPVPNDGGNSNHFSPAPPSPGTPKGQPSGDRGGRGRGPGGGRGHW